MTKSKHKVIGVLALYYPQYEKNSVSKFRNFLMKITSNYRLIIISNNSSITNKKYIAGTNSQGEFSAWQEGIDLTKRAEKDNTSLWIFANDTFCNHHRFDVLDRFIFVKKFTETLFKAEPVCCGDMSSIKAKFIYKNIEMNYWISTYLFAISNSGMVWLDYKLIRSLTNTNHSENFDRLDIALKNHLLDSINNNRKGNAWKRDPDLNFIEAYQKKLNSMINEIDLSYRMISLNFKFIKIFDGSWYKFLWRVRDLLIYDKG